MTLRWTGDYNIDAERPLICDANTFPSPLIPIAEHTFHDEVCNILPSDRPPANIPLFHSIWLRQLHVIAFAFAIKQQCWSNHHHILHRSFLRQTILPSTAKNILTNLIFSVPRPPSTVCYNSFHTYFVFMGPGEKIPI